MKIVLLGSGSKGNSTFIDLGNKKILIDVGFSYKYIKDKLEKINVDPHEIDAIFLTHDHSDHIYGLKTFLNRVKPYLFTTPELASALLEEPYDKIEYLDDEIIFDGALIKTIPTSHDATSSNGYLIEKNDISLVYVTDTGYLNQRTFTYLSNKNYYIFESNHDTELLIKGPYPEHLQRRILSDKGHLSNELAAGYLSRLIGNNTKKILLAHLSETNNREDIAMDTINKVFKENGIVFNNIECAKQSELNEVLND